MTRWICARCAVEYPDSDQPPDRCAICSDERECVEPPGQRWTTLAELERDGHHGSLHEVEPGLFGIDVEPTVGIGQRALLVRSSGGNLLWDPTGYLDDDLIAAVSGAGGVAAIAASHPHMFGVQVEWSHRFGGAPVYVNRADQDWLQRDDPVIRRWDATLEVLPGLTLNRIGGHFPGSAVLARRRRGWSRDPALRRHLPGHAGPGLGDVHAQLSEPHSTVCRGGRGRGGARALARLRPAL